MRRDHFVVDIRRNRGDSRLLIELVRRFCSSFPGANVEWLVRPDQAHLLPSDHILGQAAQFDVSWTPRIRDRLIQIAQSDITGGSLWVLSYDNMVLAEAQSLRLANMDVSHKHLSELIKTASANLSPQLNSSRLPSNFPATTALAEYRPLTLAEAATLAKDVLRQGRHCSRETALSQKDLRPLMRAIDSRAEKRFNDPTSATLIANVVDTGLQEGWLRRFRRVPDKTGTEALYLVEPEAQSIASVQSTPTPPAYVQAVPLTPLPLTTGPTANTFRANPEGPPIGAVSSEPNSARRKFPNRASEFETVLKTARIGSIPETRELFFDAIEAIVAEQTDQHLLVPELFAEASKRAQVKAAEYGYVSEKNWVIAQRCIQRLALYAEVLQSDTGTIQDKIGCNSTRVVRLVPNFRRVCEGRMAVLIIRQLGGISYDDDPYYLGLTLYRRGQQKAVPAETLKTQADELLSYLSDQRLIEMDADRKIVLATSRRTLTVMPDATAAG